MAISEDTYTALMFEDVKVNTETPLIEQARNNKVMNGLLETAFANNIVGMQRPRVQDSAALTSIMRTEMLPQIVAVGAGLAALREAIRTATPAQ